MFGDDDAVVADIPELDDADETKKEVDPYMGEDGVIRIKLKRQEIPFEIEDLAGEVHSCVLVELDGDQRDKYLNSMASRVRTNADGKVVGLKNFDGVQASLLTRCLYEIVGTERKLMNERTIQKFPSAAQTYLFNKAKKVSGLDLEAEGDAKNV